MKCVRKTLGRLSCIVADGLSGRAPELAVVLSHGFGAPGDDLLPLVDELVHEAPRLAKRVQFVFPEAPLSLDSFGFLGGRAWWMVDLNRFSAAIAQRSLPDSDDALLAGMREAASALRSVVDAVQRETALPWSRIVLGGFSQGAVMSTEVALSAPECPGGLLILSGTLVNEAAWREQAPSKRAMRIFQSHGRYDFLLPFDAAVWLKDLLESSGLAVDFLPFNGEHTIAAESLPRMAGMMADLLPAGM